MFVMTLVPLSTRARCRAFVFKVAAVAFDFNRFAYIEAVAKTPFGRAFVASARTNVAKSRFGARFMLRPQSPAHIISKFLRRFARRMSREMKHRRETNAERLIWLLIRCELATGFTGAIDAGEEFS
jgi:hypothetical protein